jgi:heme/copper-type cytochrome/quinol oxidase subunit 2
MASLAGLAAAATAAVLAVFFAATMMVIAFMASILLALAAAAVRARRSVSRAATDPNVIEARHVGGHSWVAYGWDDRR